MSQVVDQLQEMGFSKERAELAVKETGNASLETAMDWLISHEESPPARENSAEKTAETSGGDTSEKKEESTAADNPVAHSYKCNDCGRLLKDVNAITFHASKTGHENYGESSEEIKPLNDEERATQAALLKERIKASMAAKAEAEKKEAHEKELRRIAEGKKVLQMRETLKEKEQRAIIEARKREKEEDLAAKKRVLEQIRLDKEARKAGISGQPAPPPPVKAKPSAPPPPMKNYDEATIQVRLPDGQAIRNTFKANEELAAVRLWLQIKCPDLGRFELLVPFPKKTFTEADYAAPLKEHGLVPSASLVVIRAA